MVSITSTLFVLIVLPCYSGSSYSLNSSDGLAPYTVPVRVNGKEVEAIINLSDRYTFVHPSLVTEVIGQDEIVNAQVEAFGIKNDRLICRTDGFTTPRMISLGREFFKGRTLIWDIPNARLTVNETAEPLENGRKFDFETGQYKVGAATIFLPILSPCNSIPFGAPLKRGFQFFNTDERRSETRENVFYAFELFGSMQVGAPTKLFDIEFANKGWEQGIFYPGAIFFGAQLVKIDFSSMSIEYLEDSILKGVQLLALRLNSNLELKENGLVLRSGANKQIDQWFRSKGVVGLRVKRIGSLSVDPAKLGDFDYLLSLLRELESGVSVVFTDGSKDVVIG